MVLMIHRQNRDTVVKNRPWTQQRRRVWDEWGAGLTHVRHLV